MFVAIAFGAACDQSSPRLAEPPTPQTTSPDVGTGEACPQQADVVGSNETQEGTPRRADVDGDGSPDEVRLHLDFEGPVGCQAFVVVVTGTGSTVEPVWVRGADGGLPQPSLYAFADLDGNGGFEILVNEASGASTQFVGAYTLSDEDLVRVEAPRIEGGLFAFGGSVGHIEAVDCARGDRVVISQAVPAGGADAVDEDLYEITRRTYSLKSGDLRSVDVERSEVSIEDLNRYPEFSAGPFGSCAAP